MCPIEIKKGIYWVGAVDWNLRNLHSYSIYKGTTYNAYLVIDDKITLFDTVKKEFVNDLLLRISEIINPEQIDYLIINHVEKDHSGSLLEIVQRVRPKKIFCSPLGYKNLLAHFHTPDLPYKIIKNDEILNLGKRNVHFLETPMLHWPDSMFSYIPEDKLLISSDAFGLHWATSERFDDQLELTELMSHAAKYYANILLPYSSLVQKLLTHVKQINLDVDIIAPDHGIIWRSSPIKILEAYNRWSRQENFQKALIVYDTMWHSTEIMAKAIYDGLHEENNISVQLKSLANTHRSDIMAEILDAKALIIGSSTLNNNVLPRIADLLTYIKGLKPKNKIGIAFGSYGWSGEAIEIINENLLNIGIEVIHPGIKHQFVPDNKVITQCRKLGIKLSQSIIKTAGAYFPEIR